MKWRDWKWWRCVVFDWHTEDIESQQISWMSTKKGNMRWFIAEVKICKYCGETLGLK